MDPSIELQSQGARLIAVKSHRIYPEELLERRGELVMLFRVSMRSEMEAMNPERIVPIHSTAADRFQDWLPRVERRQDQQVWQV